MYRLIIAIGLAMAIASAACARPMRFDEFVLQDPVLKRLFDVIEQQANGLLDFGFNVNMRGISVTTHAVANTETTVDITSLGLDYTPTDFMQYGSDNGGYIYPSNKGSWSSTSIKIKCTVASTTATLVPFPAH